MSWGGSSCRAEVAVFLRGTLKLGDSEELPRGVEGKGGVLKGGNWISEFGDHCGVGHTACSSAVTVCLSILAQGRALWQWEPPAQAGVAGEFPSPAVLSPRTSLGVGGCTASQPRRGALRRAMYSTAVHAPSWPGRRCHHSDLLPPPPHLPEFLWGFQGPSQGSSCTGVLVRAAFGGPSTKRERLVVLVFTAECGCHPQGLWSPSLSQRHILGPHPDLLSQKHMDGPSQSPR